MPETANVPRSALVKPLGVSVLTVVSGKRGLKVTIDVPEPVVVVGVVTGLHAAPKHPAVLKVTSPAFAGRAAIVIIKTKAASASGALNKFFIFCFSMSYLSVMNYALVSIIDRADAEAIARCDKMRF